ncbi:Inner membrane amino-acid ABC transporter permease protein yhdY [Delftia tsuruhatensis]|uniref:amino acid ABC transporter permease n=1 Tax=Delftia tsuruhatensis TaxID=180282 RepID=UPI001E777CF4|nr:amino acid ABC transporter permease [Delftia tsuruhatensis]CAB5723897.1 Inner membrane amino-acid ABC transporter permease protein yhdY [Delftia tsuruhatensis]CAC9684139.1 Inner membrane amino-acid ABC transporter permease protein yhdY [Delftia tsuruhatensis]
MTAPSLLRWCRRNLFATPLDMALTCALLPLLLLAAGRLLAWTVQEARWSIVGDNLRVLMVGTFPPQDMARAWGASAALALAAGTSLWVLARPHAPWLRKALGAVWLLCLLAVGVALAPVGMAHWGGLLLSVLVTLAAAALSMVLGVLLALGRGSRHAGLRVVCTGYIELMRALPLILVVYWIWIVTPLLAPGATVPDLVRGVAAFTLFFAAYAAEYVRSGLQSVPRGQVEAAASLGLSGAQTARHIVLPQALRVAMPALVGHVLDVFNTVPLLFIIGLTDFLRAGQMVLVDPRSSGHGYEIYLFLFAVCLAVSSLVTFGARRIEARMAEGYR